MSAVALLKGLGMGGSLIVAIGAQNAFVLTHALRNQHITAIASLCIFIDALLIVAGIWGLGELIQLFPHLVLITSWAGALFLVVYGSLAFKRALQPSSLTTTNYKTITLKTALLTTLAFSLLNPHVYLDTVVLLGSIGGQLPDTQPWWFALGAALASALWFSVLAWGGKRLAPWFATPRNWQRLDIGVGLIMWTIALSLLYQA